MKTELLGKETQRHIFQKQLHIPVIFCLYISLCICGVVEK